MRRRGNGDGSIRVRKNGIPEGRLTLADGTRQSIYGKTAAEVRKKLDAAKADRDRGVPSLKGKGPTLQSFLTTWLEMKKGTREYRTWKGYSELVRNHIVPALGNVPLSRLTAQHVQRFYADRLNSGLSTTTVLHIHTLLHGALEHAMRQGLVLYNVADRVEAPQARHVEHIVLTADEAKRLIRTARNSRWLGAIVLAVTAGMREGEVLGLRWRYVDLESGVLTVSGNVQPGLNGLTLKAPKNNKLRQIKLAAYAVEVLRQQQARLAVERERAGELWHEMDLVFPNTLGGLKRCQNFVARDYRPLLVKAGVPPVKFHELRHSQATLLIALGVPLAVVSQILGHSSVKTTGDIYTHINLGMQQQATDKLDQVFDVDELLDE
jgi:integrase